MTAKTVPSDWQEISLRYLEFLKISGHPETTIDTRRQHIHFLARRIGMPPSQVTADALTKWCATQDWARETRRGRQNTYRSFWAWAKRAEGLRNVAKHLPKVKMQPGIARPTPDTVYMAALSRAPQRTKLILRLAAEIGLRRGEIAVIHSRDLIDDLLGWSLLVHGKGGKQRIVPLTGGIARDLRELPYGYAFPGNMNGHLSPRRVGELATDVLSDQWTLHTLRHRFATRAYSVDHDVFAVQELLGHASAETTRRYVSRDQTRLRALVQRSAA